MPQNVAAVLVLAALGAIVLLAPPTTSEGSDQFGVSQLVLQTTTMYVDIVLAGERIQWLDGRGDLDVFSPIDDSLLARLSVGSSYTTAVAGTFRLDFRSDQNDEWDISVADNGNTVVYPGRLWSTNWRVNAASYTASTDASFYSPFTSTLGTKVVEARFEGLAGYVYSIFATVDGIYTNTPTWKSAPKSGNAVNPALPLYLTPPATVTVSPVIPFVASTELEYVSAKCHDRVLECVAATQDVVIPRIVFETGSTGRYSVICDVNGDGGYDFISNSDVRLDGISEVGKNVVIWDGRDLDGNLVAPGNYTCKVFVYVAQIHFPLDDVESVYPGLRLFSLTPAADRIGLVMFWDDNDLSFSPVLMPNGEYSINTPPDTLAGLWSGEYADPFDANDNSRAWGAFQSNSKGNNAYVNTFSLVERNESNAFVLEIKDGAAVNCPFNTTASFWSTNVTEGDFGTTTIYVDYSFNVPLKDDATLSVSIVPGTATPGDDYVVPPATLFLPRNEVCGNFTLTVVADIIAETDETFTLLLDFPAPSFVLHIVEGATIPFAIYNDDPLPTISWATSSVSVSEGFSGFTLVTLTARLTRGMSSDVIVSYSTRPGLAYPTSDFTPVPSGSATISAGDVAVDIVVSVVADNLREDSPPSEDFFVIIDSASGLTIVDGNFTVEIVDDDPTDPGITATILSSAVTSESGTTARFSVVLDAPPLDDVVVPVFLASAADEASLSAAWLTFVYANWSVPHVVTVTGLDDAVVDGDVVYTVAVGSASTASTDPSYAGATAPAPLTFTNIDNDVAGVAVSALAPAAATTTEIGPGSTATFTVALTSEPVAFVTVSFTSSDTDQATVTPFVVFGPANYSSPALVTITGVSENVDDGDVAYTVTIHPAVSSDPVYSGRAPSTSSHALTQLNNDNAGILVSSLSTASTYEATPGSPATFTVVLTSQPLSNVDVTIVSSDTTEATVSAPSPIAPLVFTPGNWNLPVTVSVTSVDDPYDDGNIAYSVNIMSAVSADGKYSGRAPSITSHSLTNFDNDVAGVTLTALSPSSSVSEAGLTSTAFTVALTAAPAAAFTAAISFASSDTSEGVVAPLWLAFDDSNYSSPVTVTVTAVDDFVDDGNVPFSVSIGNVVSGDAAYSGLSPPFSSYSLTNVDNDTAALVLSAPSGNTDEGGATATLSLSLASQPTSSISVTVVSSDTDEAVITSPAMPIVIAPGVWNSLVTVTVAGVDDALIDGAQALQITASVASGDATYSSVPSVARTLINLDDDTTSPTLIVSPASNDLDEAALGTTASFTVRLSNQPAPGKTVSVALSSSDTTEGTVLPLSLNFDDATWSTPAPVTVSAVDDPDDDGPITFNIVLADTTSDDPPFVGIVTAPVSITTLDDDAAGLVVSTTTPAAATVTEAGSVLTFTVQLAARPPSNVTVSVASSANDEGTVSPAALVFGFATWNTPQTVTVTGANDDVDDGDVPFAINLGPSTGAFVGLTASVAVLNLDDDSAGFDVTAPSSLTVTEAGSTSTFTVVLLSEPLVDVTVPVAVSDATEASVLPASIVFTAGPSGNWGTPATVTVTGVNDNVDDGPIGFSVTLGPASAPGDALYHNAAVTGGNVALTTLDDDTASVAVSTASGPVTEAGPGTATFTVVLTSEPTADVTVSVASTRPLEGTVAPTSIVFTSGPLGNWGTPVTVTVTGVDDDVDDGDIAFAASLGPATSSDPLYSGKAVPSVGLLSVDDDTAGFVISALSTGGTVTEAVGSGRTATYTVALSSRPLATVTLSGIASSDTGSGTVTPSSIAFAPAAWASPVTVTVTGVDDEVDDGDVAFVISAADVVSTDTVYDVKTVPDVPVVNVDNDTAAIVVVGRLPHLTTSEAGLGDDLWVVLTSEPAAGSMFVPVASSNVVEASVTPSALTFTSANWRVPRKVRVSGKNDGLADGSVAYTVNVGPASSTGADYSGLAAVNASWPAVNAAAASAAFVIAGPTGPTSEEPSGASFTVALASAPIAPVSVPIASSDATEGVVVSPAGGWVNFTTSNWNVPQTVSVMGVVDSLDDGNVAYAVTLGPCLTSSLDYSGFSFGVPMLNLDTLPALNVTLLDGGVTSEGGGVARFEVGLAKAPPQDVVIVVSSSDPGEGVPVGSTVLPYSSDTWFETHVVTFQGVPDGIVDGPQPYLAQLTVTDGSTEWMAFSPPGVALVNLDVPVVTVIGASPGVAPALGGINHTVTGTGFAPGAVVGVGVAYVRAEDTVVLSSTAIAIVSPAQNVSSLPFLATVNVTNPDGGFGELAEAIEFTNDCPFEGMFGSGTDCVPCPSCGYCPGGGRRICALPGCWNEGIDSGGVGACDPPERCLGGGREAPCLPVCADGYAGAFCASCAQGYYALGTECLPCESGAESFPFAVVITYFAFLSLLAVISFFGSSRSVHLVGFFLLMLQWLLAVGTMAPQRTPSLLKLVYLQFGVASFSVELLKPGCLVSESSFPLVFYATLALFGAMGALIVTGVSLSAVWQTKMSGRAWADDVGPEFWHRLGRSLTILLSVGYFALTQMSLRVVHCVDTPFGSYMQSDASVKCYDATHTPMMSVAVAVLVVLTLGFLVLAFWRQYRHQKKQELEHAMAQIEAAQFNNMLEDGAAADEGAVARKYLDEEKWWFAAMWLLSMLVLAVAATILTEYPVWQFAACAFVFCSAVVTALRAAPFLAHWRNKSSAIFAAFCALCAGFNFAASDEFSVSDDTLTIISYVLLFMLFAIVAMWTVLVVRSVRRNLYYKMQDAGEEGVLADGEAGGGVDLGLMFAAVQTPKPPPASSKTLLSRGVKVSPSPVAAEGAGGAAGAAGGAAGAAGWANDGPGPKGRLLSDDVFAEALGRAPTPVGGATSGASGAAVVAGAGGDAGAVGGTASGGGASRGTRRRVGHRKVASAAAAGAHRPASVTGAGARGGGGAGAERSTLSASRLPPPMVAAGPRSVSHQSIVAVKGGGGVARFTQGRVAGGSAAQQVRRRSVASGVSGSVSRSRSDSKQRHSLRTAGNGIVRSSAPALRSSSADSSSGLDASSSSGAASSSSSSIDPALLRRGGGRRSSIH